ncbi:MAG: helix-turn-helix domain-containing protein [Gordonia sp. (in: high G+C Gram-positive bacteria)]|uniref:helix-turn-helix domain-containing protein n=1 Tax=Gordonia sp. (in: high G+C Gram-positive bacteria) TaxID=84139 RepID=UPI003C75DF6A
MAPVTETWTVADALAHGWAYSTIYRHLRRGVLESAYKLGREWRFDRAELESLKAPTVTEVAEPAEDELSPEVREWARARAAEAPPMRYDEARVVVAMFARAAKKSADQDV